MCSLKCSANLFSAGSFIVRGDQTSHGAFGVIPSTVCCAAPVSWSTPVVMATSHCYKSFTLRGSVRLVSLTAFYGLFEPMRRTKLISLASLVL